MGSCCSCLCPDSIPDNHPTKFKVTNVDDEGHELGSGVMELTPRELILHTHKRDAVRWPYLSLRRYGFDSNLFSFESGRHCHTGQGIFAFKCSRAEEIFNLLQDLMQCNSINVVEEPVVITRNSHPQERELAHSPQGPTSKGTAQGTQGWQFPSPGGFSAALLRSVLSPPFTVPLLLSLQSHTYVNTGEPEPRGRHRLHSLPEAHPPFPPRNHSCSLEDRNPQVFLQPGEVKFVLAPTSGYRRLCRQPRQCRPHLCPPNNNNNECQQGCPSPQCVYENLNGLVAPSTSSLCRAARSKASLEDGSCSQRRSALLHYENLPALPPRGDEDAATAPTPSPNGFSEAGEEEPLQNPAGSEPRRAFLPRPRRSRLPNVFSFDFPRPCPEPPRQLNYIQVELEPEGCKGQQEPRVAAPASPGARRTDSYAIIDLKKTAAMSSLQRALPRDDGTSRKTRHNSTDLPL
uniref:Fibroblast growth factor receptor substrate 3 n=1 Tax=Serinus canaria TaxID=9135 RepID=A0A8C9KNU8_SERCA